MIGHAKPGLAATPSWSGFALCMLAVLAPFPSLNAESPAELAARVDQTLMSELGLTPETVAPQADEATLIRRLRLDTVGVPPERNDIARDLERLRSDDLVGHVQDLLSRDEFGTNWGRYWRDVILYRRSEERALLASRPAEEFLADQFRQNRPWNETATAFVTAKGDVYEDGRTALIFAQQGRPEETAAEVSRIFLGIQIQCAQCHDHKTDAWTREQFHELAAFFPRVAARPTMGDTPGYTVVAADTFFFAGRKDANNRFRGTAEHKMPDLDRPEEPGTTMTPKLFVTGDSVKVGTTDEDRRAALAAWVTSPNNEWFAKAFVNRTWAELIGWGFYEPIDDLGPERPCAAPETMQILEEDFVESGYDVKRLFETILLTEAYRRESRPISTDPADRLASATLQPLRGDQLYDAMLRTLELPDEFSRYGTPDEAMQKMQRLVRSPRFFVNSVFGFDPSLSRDEVQATIPQALAMMNSPIVNMAVSAYRRQGPSALIRSTPDNETLAKEIYLRALSRMPTEEELRIVDRYVATARSRNEAYEDLLWALVNSTEFARKK